MWAITFLYFNASGIQYWSTDFMTKNLQAEKSTVYFIFMVTLLTAPVGAVFSSKVGQKLEQGWSSGNGTLILTIAGLICAIIGLPLAWVDEIATFSILLWFVIFIGAFIVPGAYQVLLD